MEQDDGRPGGLSSCGSSPTVSTVPASIPDADYDDDWQDEGCYECGGEGFISNCVEEWACVDPEYGCDYCTRRCPLCNPAKRNPELQQVLAAAIAQGIETGTAETERLSPKGESPVPQECAPTPSENNQ